MHDSMVDGLVMKRHIASKSRFNSYLPTLATFRRFQPPHPTQDEHHHPCSTSYLISISILQFSYQQPYQANYESNFRAHASISLRPSLASAFLQEFWEPSNPRRIPVCVKQKLKIPRSSVWSCAPTD